MAGYNEELVRRADTVIADLAPGGVMLTEQSDTFFEKLFAEPTIINECRQEIMSSAKREVDKLSLASRILDKAVEATATTAKKPGFGKVTLDCQEVIAQINMSYNVLEDNIEKEGFADRLISMMARRSALDLEELVIRGDTGSGDNYLTTFNGVLKQMDGGNISDALNVAIGGDVFKGALKTMPDAYTRNRNALRFYVAVDQEIEYRSKLAARQTGLGDALIQGNAPVYGFGVPVVPVSMMTATQGLLIDPMNIILGFHRELRIETDRDIEKRLWKIVLTMRTDCKIEETEGAVRIDNILTAS